MVVVTDWVLFMSFFLFVFAESLLKTKEKADSKIGGSSGVLASSED
jgi:hypothetical protein